MFLQEDRSMSGELLVSRQLTEWRPDQQTQLEVPDLREKDRC